MTNTDYLVCGFLIATVFVCASNVEATIPSYIPVCHKNDPQVDACIRNSIETLRPRLVKGIPELTVPPLEPLKVNQALHINFGGSGSSPTNLTDIEIYGASSFQILELRSKISKNYFRFKVNCPKLFLEGKYQINAKILFLELRGEGPLKINVTDYSFECVLQGNKIKREKEEYLKFDKLTCTGEFKNAKVTLENLFNGDPVLGKATNDVINDNINSLFEDIRPTLLKAITDRFLETANRITTTFTYRELFL